MQASGSVSQKVIVGVSFKSGGSMILKVILVPFRTEIGFGVGFSSLKLMVMTWGCMVVSWSAIEVV
ncbi:hypothetical protein HK404_07055 [Myxococcus xanthus]|nr:hypothetical protein [Myxococcus xanthus]